MKIIVITNSYPNKTKPYAGKHVERHIEMHRQERINVKVYSPGDSRTGSLFATWKYFRLTLKLFWAALTQSVDLVHAHWVLPAGLFGAFLAGVRRKPLVITSHGAFTNTFDQRHPIVQRLVRWVLSRADKIIAVGSEQQEKIEAITRLPVGSVASINMGVLIPDSIPSRQKARNLLNLSTEKRIVLFIGNLLKRKGPDLLIQAVAGLDDTADLKLYIGGQGPESKPLTEQIIKLGLERTVSIIGPVEPEKVLIWMAAADICVVPSRTEPFGLVAIESLAAGTPVIAAAVGGLTETIKDGYNGLLFPIDDHKALTSCIKTLLANPVLLEKMASVASESIVQHDMKIKANQILEIYREF